ncbi:venom carboxylesterase-6-like isoform X1 [Diorhabda carinulata]|uniref:venom carboxylesterase-6-like isoform X1 n=1 Tax=Diorhabda carinulata TaxID=1163345 RepID=UPI0025A13853|nr:venom carboxylesterase-6-like isoform X1 [Diorhabda carinulata]
MEHAKLDQKFVDQIKMGWTVFLLCLAPVLFENSIGASSVLQTTKNFEKLKIRDGLIRGTVEQTIGNGTKYYRFLGIPYAEPPVGDLRFEPPRQNRKWSGVLNATTDASQCVQGTQSAKGSEDCLYINVYTPNLQGNLSVMVWIYGGAFINGNSSYENYPPDFFLDHNVVFVSFNYRLGIFGFLSTGDLVAPGNAALKDQQLALNWVQENIKYFGGDPKKVTIFGESAGAVAVSYQLQSTRSRGLFRSAIMQSGNTLCLWALNRRAREIAFNTGKLLNINTSNSSVLVEGLKKVNYSTLHQFSLLVATVITLKNPLAGIMYSPVMEPCHEGAFFCNRSDDLLKNGEYYRVPVIIGVNSNEGVVAKDLPALFRLYLIKYDIDYKSLAPTDLTSSSSNKSSAAIDIRFHYFGVFSIALQENAIVKFISDDQFNRPTRRTVLNMAKYSPVYFYVFSYKGLLGDGTEGVKGVGHGEDLGYLFSNTNNTERTDDQIVRTRLITLWTNFAKYGNPTPRNDNYLQNVRWQTASSDSSNLTYLNISDDLRNEVNPFDNNMKFYDTVYRKYGSGSYDTY